VTVELDPAVIVIRNRQRKAITNIDDLFIKSVTERLIHPIVLRREDDQILLVVGGRRLEAMKRGGVNPLVENTHFRFFEDLSPNEARKVELEENAKRLDLTWREHAAAVGELDQIYRQENDKWDASDTGNYLNIGRAYTYEILKVYKNLDNPNLRDATSIKSAIATLQISAERAASQFADQIADVSRNMFGTPANPATPGRSPTPPSPNGQDPNPNPTYAVAGGNPVPIDLNSPFQPPDGPDPVNPVNNSDSPVLPGLPTFVLNTDALRWLSTYDGPKFNLIHCDFPFDIRYDSYAKSVTSTSEDYDFTGFWPLTDTLIENINRVFSYSGHIMFWFSMKFYQQTKDRLEKVSDLYVHEHPFIWLKSDNAGIIPGRDNAFPRRIYETAFLCTRNKRPLVKSISNAYAAPTASNPVHPSQKPEPVLRHFFSGLIDETTDILDPTCGSGTALRAADSMDARTIVGLESNKLYADTAESLCQSHRRLRHIRL
jgi:hypothetical protein